MVYRGQLFQLTLHHASGEYPIAVHATTPTAAVTRALGILVGRIRITGQGKEVRDTLQRITIIPCEPEK